MNRRAFMTGALTSPILATGVRAPRSMETFSKALGKYVPWREELREGPVRWWMTRAKIMLNRECWFRTLTKAQWDSLKGKWDPYKPHPLVVQRLRQNGGSL